MNEGQIELVRFFVEGYSKAEVGTSCGFTKATVEFLRGCPNATDILDALNASGEKQWETSTDPQDGHVYFKRIA